MLILVQGDHVDEKTAHLNLLTHTSPLRFLTSSDSRTSRQSIASWWLDQLHTQDSIDTGECPFCSQTLKGVETRPHVLLCEASQLGLERCMVCAELVHGIDDPKESSHDLMSTHFDECYPKALRLMQIGHTKGGS
jgi:hypothetical protein